MNRMNAILDPLSLPEGWQLGAEVGQYIVGNERSTYFMQSPLRSITYDTGTTGEISMDQFWDSDNRSAIEMATITGYAMGKDIPMSGYPTYHDVEALIPDSDPMTMLLIIYLMNPGSSLHYDMEYGPYPAVILRVPGGGTITANLYRQDPDPQLKGEIRDLDILYELSPMYKGLPSEVSTITELFQGRLHPDGIYMFQELVSDALSIDIGYGGIIDRATAYVSGPQAEVHSLLMRCVAKHRLLLRVCHPLDGCS